MSDVRAPRKKQCVLTCVQLLPILLVVFLSAKAAGGAAAREPGPVLTCIAEGDQRRTLKATRQLRVKWIDQQQVGRYIAPSPADDGGSPFYEELQGALGGRRHQECGHVQYKDLLVLAGGFNITHEQFLMAMGQRRQLDENEASSLAQLSGWANGACVTDRPHHGTWRVCSAPSCTCRVCGTPVAPYNLCNCALYRYPLPLTTHAYVIPALRLSYAGSPGVTIFNMTSRKWTAGPPLPNAANHNTLAVSPTGVLYSLSSPFFLYNTRPVDPTYTASLHSLDLEAVLQGRPATWQERRAGHVPGVTGGFACAFLDDRMYCLGGASSPSHVGDGYSAALTSYDPAKDTWQTHAPCPEPHHHAEVFAHEGRLWMVGGVSYMRDLPSEEQRTWAWPHYQR